MQYFTKHFTEEQINVFTTLLDDNNPVLQPSTHIVNTIWEYDKFLKNETYNAEAEGYISPLFKMYFDILLSCYRMDEIAIFVNDFLHCSEYGSLCGKVLLSFQTDLAIKFADSLKLIEITAKWIVEYFQRSKSTHVDLNRYKLETFLLKNDAEQINEFIVNSLVSDNKYVREHMADIVGEKNLTFAEDNLIMQLKRETNIYTTSSIVEALGKICSKKSLPTILEWLEKNADKTISNGDYFAIKHFRNAIVKIDNKKTLKDFDQKYFDILKANNEI